MVGLQIEHLLHAVVQTLIALLGRMLASEGEQLEHDLLTAHRRLDDPLQVLDLLGPPEEFLRSEVLGSLGDDSSRVSGAVALGNRAQDAFTYQLDTLSAWASMLLFYNHVRGQIETDLLVIFFDQEDRVREVSLRTVSRNP